MSVLKSYKATVLYSGIDTEIIQSLQQEIIAVGGYQYSVSHNKEANLVVLAPHRDYWLSYHIPIVPVVRMEYVHSNDGTIVRILFQFTKSSKVAYYIIAGCGLFINAICFLAMINNRRFDSSIFLLWTIQLLQYLLASVALFVSSKCVLRKINRALFVMGEVSIIEKLSRAL